MATDVSSLPANGSHAPHSGYDGSQVGYSASAASSTQNSAAGATSEIPKDEVGWYFVEQYYTTLSRSPEKLYLFYNKRSQFVLGDETDKVAVCVGQKSINERIKDLDFQDCKVRVTNVDSQASDTNIVIQVIGEISNKSQPHKKFVQTFILAGQTNGYFVLNDIFRYLIDEEEAEEEAPTQETPMPQSTGLQEPAPTASGDSTNETLTSSDNPTEVEQSAQIVDKELKEKASSSTDAVSPAVPAVNGVSNTTASSSATTDEPTDAAIPEAGVTASSSTLEPEKPKDPSPTPSVSPPKKAAQPAQSTTPAQPAAASANAGTPASAPTKPAAPKTWANLLAASNRVATPAIPSQANASQTSNQTSNQPKALTAAPSTQAPAQTPVNVAAEEPSPRDPSPAGSQQDEWTSVGDNRRQQGRTQANTNAQEGPQHRAYIKNVHDSMDTKQLKSTLEKFGELAYFDISRQKSCAFVDFKTAEGYKAAMDANPHHIGNDRIFVEERRMKPGAYPYVPRGGMRGGRGAPAQGTNRGSFQGNRGGFTGRGRGGNTGSVRGRGGAQAA
ncbi:hypothetical protein K461DRAFT_274889 [Myriangium duriaei CBS 260.36]|uniref:NTF2 domain-containing protein n=1 Tax=Myriangium duriaei CBS 260.36 TaxID=1168546 RepID=A0A9P4JBA4_9PEZI|nr:hypothetical protein K461DRAFT_274889 [Myriangium duriaei CBS 260.36]